MSSREGEIYIKAAQHTVSNLLAVLRGTMPRQREGSRITSRLLFEKVCTNVELPFPQKVNNGGIADIKKEDDQRFPLAYVKYDFAKVMATNINLANLDTQKTFKAMRVNEIIQGSHGKKAHDWALRNSSTPVG